MKNLIYARALKLALLISFEYLKRNRKWVISSFILITVLLFAYFKFNFFYPEKSISLGFIGTYQEHDLPLEVLRLLSQSLVKADDNGRIKPYLVSGWETNNDATEFKFKLKEGLKWADGTDISASELEFSIPSTEVSYPDNKTIQFKLKESYSPLPSLLTNPIFKKGTLLGIGPYRITRIEKSRIFITKIILKSDDHNLPVIYIRFYPNEKVGVIGFSLGEVQAFLGLSNLKVFSSNPKVGTLQKTDFTKIVTILFQTQDPILKNRSLRQALAYGAPKVAGEEEANNPYPSNFWAYNSESKKYLSNPKEASEALDRAKSSLPDDKLHGELILTTTPNLEEVGEVIIKSWKALGFDVKLRIESGIPQNFQSLLITQSIPVDPDQYFLWHATQTKTNLTKYDSKRVDKDLEDGRKALTEEERKTNYFDFQKTLLEDAPATFLYFPKYNIVYLKKVEKLLDKVLTIQF